MTTDPEAVQADDALLNALRGPNPVPEGSDARLTQILMAWQREVDSEPMPHSPLPGDVVARCSCERCGALRSAWVTTYLCENGEVTPRKWLMTWRDEVPYKGT